MGLMNLRTEAEVPNAAVASVLNRMAALYEHNSAGTLAIRDEVTLHGSNNYEFFHTTDLEDPDWILQAHDGWWVRFGTLDHYRSTFQEEYFFCAPVRVFGSDPRTCPHTIDWERCVMADDVDLLFAGW